MLGLLSKFAQYNYDYDSYFTNSQDYQLAQGLSAGVIITILLVVLVVSVMSIIGAWKTYQKAKQPGWASIVPIYNIYILQKIVGRPTWWTWLYFVPFVNLVVAIINCNDLAKSFGKDVGFTVLLVVFPFIAYLILGFGSAKYHGPSVAAN